MRRTTRTLLVAGIATLVFSSCSETRHDLPSLSGATPSPVSTLETIARNYYTCMSDAGIDVTLGLNQDSQLAIVDVSEGHVVLIGDENGYSWSGPQGAEPPNDSLRFDGPHLEVDGVDHSATYAQCLQQSGYDAQAALGDTYPDPLELAAQAEVNNAWAQCARDHGWPMIEDSTYSTSDTQPPSIYVPAAITADQLSQLMADCAEAAESPTQLQPSIGLIDFDDALMGDDDTDLNPAQQAYRDHLDELYAILEEGTTQQ